VKTAPKERHKLKRGQFRLKTSHEVFDGTLQKLRFGLNDLASEARLGE
jgi:hypothetical protein